MHLQRAQLSLADEDWDMAVEAAEAARGAARDSAEFASPIRYLIGTLLLADAYEQTNDDMNVLRSWLTCRTYLTNTMGSSVGKGIDTVLDILSQRWGRPRMSKAILRYQHHVAQHGKFEV